LLSQVTGKKHFSHLT
jgi:hypothetical protein